MKIKIAYFACLISGLFIVNLYIYWLSTKIVPFSIELPICLRKNFNFSVSHLYPGKHAVGIFFTDKGDDPVKNIKGIFTFKCKIIEMSSNKTVYSRQFDIKNMDVSGLAIKYIPNADVGYFLFPISANDTENFFSPKYYSDYSVQIEIIEITDNFYKYNPLIGLYCTDIDQGYFGGEYIVYNILYMLFIGIIIACLYLYKKIIN